MAADATNVTRLKNMTFNAVAVGFCQNVVIRHTFADDSIQGEGNTFQQGILTVGEMIEVEADFLNGPNVSPSSAPATMIINDVKDDGTNVATNITLMKPRDFASSRQVGGKTLWHQKFVSVGNSVIS